MALRVGISVPKPAKFYSAETFLGAGTVIAGDEVIKRVMPYITPRIPLTGDPAAIANIAIKSLIGFGMFYGAKRTTGMVSDVLYGASFGAAIATLRDVIDFVRAKLTAPATVAAVRPTVTVTPAPAPSPAGAELY